MPLSVIDIQFVEDCFDGSFIREFVLSDSVTEETAKRLAQIGELQYYADFPRPLYKIIRRDRFKIKGVVGKTVFKVVFAARMSVADLEDFLNLLRAEISIPEDVGLRLLEPRETKKAA